MNTAVFVPSHIHYDDQLLRLAECISSLINQSYTSQIHVSISFEDRFKSELDKLIRSFPEVEFDIHIMQKFQMDHIKYLSNKYGTRYDLIFFCDDDDTYHPMRVELMVKTFETKSSTNDPDGVCNGKPVNGSLWEYWQYALTPNKLNRFFQLCDGYFDQLQNVYGDIFFQKWLSQFRFVNILTPTVLLYNYKSKQNPNSILTRAENNEIPLSEAAFLAALVIIVQNLSLKRFENAAIKKRVQKHIRGMQRARSLLKLLI